MGQDTGRTDRLDLSDATLREWDATVLDVDDDGIVLDRSAFYPGGGGQPPDHGVLLWGGVQTRIMGTRRGDDLRLVPHEDDPVPVAGTAVGSRDTSGQAIGVAPGARWIAVKMLNDSGYGYDSWIHAAFEWLMAPEGDHSLAPDVVNASWGIQNDED